MRRNQEQENDPAENPYQAPRANVQRRFRWHRSLCLMHVLAIVLANTLAVLFATIQPGDSAIAILVEHVLGPFSRYRLEVAAIMGKTYLSFLPIVLFTTYLVRPNALTFVIGFVGAALWLTHSFSFPFNWL